MTFHDENGEAAPNGFFYVRDPEAAAEQALRDRHAMFETNGLQVPDDLVAAVAALPSPPRPVVVLVAADPERIDKSLDLPHLSEVPPAEPVRPEPAPVPAPEPHADAFDDIAPEPESEAEPESESEPEPELELEPEPKPPPRRRGRPRKT